MSRAVLISGATGKQGGALINALLEHSEADFLILAITRTSASASAQALVAKAPEKIKLVEGNLDDPDALFAKAKEVTSVPVWGVYSVQVAMGNGQNATTEERQGKNLVDAALKNNVKYFVYSSVDRGGESSIDRPTDVPHFVSKHNIEHHLINATKGPENTMDWTILRPTAFYDNFTPDFFGRAMASWCQNELSGKKLQMIAASDIGKFGAKAFLYPEQYKGRAISLAGDELSFEEIAATFKEVTGDTFPTTWRFIASIMSWMIKEIGYMFRFFRNTGYQADIEALRKELPELKTWKTWLETESKFNKKKN